MTLTAAVVLCAAKALRRIIRSAALNGLVALAAACSDTDAGMQLPAPAAPTVRDAAPAAVSDQHDSMFRGTANSTRAETVMAPELSAQETAADAGNTPDAGTCGARASWQRMSHSAAPQARSHPYLHWTGTELLVFGDAPDGGFYSAATDAWRPMAPASVNTYTMSVASAAYIFFDNDSLVTNADAQQLAVYDIAANTFLMVSQRSAPDAKRQGFVFAGAVLLAWGGAAIDPAGMRWVGTNAGARYDLTQARWTPMSRQGAPAERLGASNVAWTGSQLVVWGGLSGNTIDEPGVGRLECSQAPHDGCPRFGDGALYDLEHDRWTAMSTRGAPAPRSEHVLAWTGQRVLVWGGSTYRSSNFVQYVDGALYDPAADVWTPTAAAPFDASRVHDAPIWTGSHLLVVDRVSVPRAAWLYDPSDDTWLTLAAAPPGCGAFAAQAGSIIAQCGTRLGRLDPAQNTWTWTDLPADAPEHVGGVLWTGERWFVWGGYRLGPTPANTCAGASGRPCDPAGPSRIATNDGWTLCTAD